MPSVQVKNYYETLGVPRTASEKEIRAAYRKLARQHHPDLNPGDKGAEERFKEVNEAHEVLIDPDKRKLFDRFGEDWQRYRDAGFTGDERTATPGAGGGAASRAGRGATFDPNDFTQWYSSQGDGSGDYTFYAPNETDESHSDFFETLFGQRGSPFDRFSGFGGGFSSSRARPRSQATPARPRRGEDAQVPVEVSFDEAFRGASRQIQLQVSEPCPTCGGTGEARGQECPTCDGTGSVRRTKTLEVAIPPGIDSGKRVRMAGQGGPGLNGGPAGDVNLIITVRPDRRFERDGDNLRTDVDVPVTTAVLGGEVEVSTPSGMVALTVPPETQSGRSFRLRGQGMPKLRHRGGERGDLLARARIVTPTALSDRERELFQELRELREERSS
ncbi:MAG: J domain-containing protein [Chloroflexota bacterium]|nr:J domain-containing protein [Chloroflexia bacterium]MDQ3225795.1 J domain-containing protein [Chloroflexota bacterium]